MNVVHTAGDAQSFPETPPPPPPQDDFEADLETLNEVIMAVNVTDRGTVGCSYYVARTETLYFMEDLRMGGHDIVDARKYPGLLRYLYLLNYAQSSCLSTQQS